jgi:hypothetical protein
MSADFDEANSPAVAMLQDIGMVLAQIVRRRGQQALAYQIAADFELDIGDFITVKADDVYTTKRS